MKQSRSTILTRIFIPQTVGSYFVYAQNILAIEMNDKTVTSTLLKAAGNTRTILSVKKITIESQDSDGITHAIENALLEPYDQVYLVIPSSQVILKEAELPFVGHDKIKKVLPFEIESHIPFSVDQAVIDSIVINTQTAKDTSQAKTTAYAAITKKATLEQYLAPFRQLNIPIDKVTVDILELYALYTNTQKQDAYTSEAVVDINLDSTRVMILMNQQLVYARTLTKGLHSVAKDIPVNHGTQMLDSLAYILKAGIDTSSNQSGTAFNELLNEITFTIKNYLTRHTNLTNVQHITLMGRIVDVAGITAFMQSSLQTPCSLFTTQKLLTSGTIQSEITPINNSYITTIAAALTLPRTAAFNLQQLYPNERQQETSYYQLMVAGILAATVLLGYATLSFFTARSLKKQYTQLEQQAITKLKRSFTFKRANQTQTLESALKAAKKELLDKETAWNYLSEHNRTALLRYLIEISKCINLQESGLELSQITISLPSRDFSNQDSVATVELFGQVQNYTQLNKLQNQLACPLFNKIPKLHELNFKQTPIVLTVKEEYA